MQILNIQDKYRSDIKINERFVHTIDTDTLQLEKGFLERYQDNELYILHKVPPRLCKEWVINSQEVDLPVELIEVLILGMAVKAHGMGALTNDPRTGTSYVQNPYIDRYELAIQKAQQYGYLPPENVTYRSVWDKGFI